MNTYTGEKPNNTQGGGNVEKTDSVEDLFLPGGFDSFSGTSEPVNAGMGQMNGNMGQLGSVDYGNAYGTVDYSANRWSNPVVFLNFKEQILNSFKPSRYDRYKGMTEGAAKEFVKSFTRLYLRIGYLMIAIMMLVVLGGMGGNVGVVMIIVIMGISYFISVLLEPYIFRLRAFIYRLIFGNLILALTKADITDTDMYLVSIYAGVPCMAVSILMLGIVLLAYWIFPSLLYFMSAVSSIFSIVQLIVPIVIMAIAIPKMK